MMHKIRNIYFLSQPHQPLFLMAFLNAVVFMVVFMLSFKGVLVLKVSPLLFHSFGLIYLFFALAFLGFVFITFPKFLQTKAIKKSFFLSISFLFFVADMLYLFGAIYSLAVYQLSLVVFFVAFLISVFKLYQIYKSSTSLNKYDTFWILLSFVFGVISSLLFILSHIFYTQLSALSVQIGIYLFIFMLTLSVAQKMVPFFSHIQLVKNKNFLKYTFILLVGHIICEVWVEHSSFLFDFLLSIVIAKELFRWKMPFFDKNSMVWILHLALFWMPISFLASSITNALGFFYEMNFLYLDIHILMIGFVFTMLVGFGSRVTLGHSGNKIISNKLIKFIFIWTQIVVFTRIAVSLLAGFDMNFMILFDISASVWILSFLLWFYQFFKILIFGKKIFFRFSV